MNTALSRLVTHLIDIGFFASAATFALYHLVSLYCKQRPKTTQPKNLIITAQKRTAASSTVSPASRIHTASTPGSDSHFHIDEAASSVEQLLPSQQQTQTGAATSLPTSSSSFSLNIIPEPSIDHSQQFEEEKKVIEESESLLTAYPFWLLSSSNRNRIEVIMNVALFALRVLALFFGIASEINFYHDEFIKTETTPSYPYFQRLTNLSFIFFNVYFSCITIYSIILWIHKRRSFAKKEKQQRQQQQETSQQQQLPADTAGRLEYYSAASTSSSFITQHMKKFNTAYIMEYLTTQLFPSILRVLSEINNSTAMMVSIMYWCMIVPFGSGYAGKYHDIAKHGGSFVFTFAELLLANMTYQTWHVSLVLLWPSGYLIFLIFLYELRPSSGFPYYIYLDYDRAPILGPLDHFFLIAGFAVLFFIFHGIGKLRNHLVERKLRQKLNKAPEVHLQHPIQLDEVQIDRVVPHEAEAAVA